MFKEFKYFIKNQTGKKIKVFKSDNGGEYMSKELMDFFKKEEIKKETIFPYTLEQNGVAERKNKSIIEVSHAMLYDQNMSKFLWGEATNDAICAQNKVNHKALDNRTHKEVSASVKPDVCHICIFG